MLDSEAAEIFLWNGINPPDPMPRQFRAPCPECGPTRKNKRQKSVVATVTDDYARWYCYNCGFVGLEEFTVAAGQNYG